MANPLAATVVTVPRVTLIITGPCVAPPLLSGGGCAFPRACATMPAMIYIGLHTLLPPPSVYYTPPALRERAAPIVSNPPFRADVLDAPTAPGKTPPATTIIERLRRDGDG